MHQGGDLAGRSSCLRRCPIIVGGLHRPGVFDVTTDASESGGRTQDQQLQQATVFRGREMQCVDARYFTAAGFLGGNLRFVEPRARLSR